MSTANVIEAPAIRRQDDMVLRISHDYDGAALDFGPCVRLEDKPKKHKTYHLKLTSSETSVEHFHANTVDVEGMSVYISSCTPVITQVPCLGALLAAGRWKGRTFECDAIAGSSRGATRLESAVQIAGDPAVATPSSKTALGLVLRRLAPGT